MKVYDYVGWLLAQQIVFGSCFINQLLLPELPIPIHLGLCPSGVVG